MQSTDLNSNKHNQRVKAYRSRLQNQGVKRVEVRIPTQDVRLLHSIADTLRTGGSEALSLREHLHQATGNDKHTTGKDLVAFFQASPLQGTDLDLERDTTTSRTVSFE